MPAPPDRFSFLFSRLFPLPFILAGGLTLWFGIKDIRNGKDSVNWPITTGQVTSSTVIENSRSGSSSSSYRGRVKYEFSVDGKKFRGDRVTYAGTDSGAPSLAEAIVRRYPEGKAVKVYYQPDNPKENVLEPGLTGDAWFVPGLGLLFFTVGCGMAIGLPKLMSG